MPIPTVTTTWDNQTRINQKGYGYAQPTVASALVFNKHTGETRQLEVTLKDAQNFLKVLYNELIPYYNNAENTINAPNINPYTQQEAANGGKWAGIKTAGDTIDDCISNRITVLNEMYKRKPPTVKQYTEYYSTLTTNEKLWIWNQYAAYNKTISAWYAFCQIPTGFAVSPMTQRTLPSGETLLYK